MPKSILQTTIERKIGHHYVNQRLSNPKGKYHTVSFVIIKESTREEYVKCMKELNGRPGRHWPESKYYEFLID